MPAPTHAPDAGRMDRRRPTRGDQRRDALLRALSDHLKESRVEAINIAAITRQAGLTRSSFYFYFVNKSAAVAALMAEPYVEMIDVNAHLVDRSVPYQERIEGMIRGMVAVWERHEHLFRAMLAARSENDEVRILWDTDRESFVPGIAAMIEADRADGIAPPGEDATALASMLSELNERALERLTLGGPLEREALVRTVVHIWLSSIYGRAG